MSLVGLDSLMNQAWSLVMDESVRSIAILGEGGIGKTTLMRQLYNKLATSKHYKTVIWVTVSSNLTFEKVQDDISKSIGLFDATWVETSFRGKAQILLDKLSGRDKFVLFLDDLWEWEVDLQGLGIPFGERYKENGSKLIFTTRLETVARGMYAPQILTLKKLSMDDAWQLFWNKVGDEKIADVSTTQQSYVYMIAEILVAKCGGLPLLLSVLGRVMAGRKRWEEWFYALDEIHRMKGNDSEVTRLLEFCFNRLPNHAIKSCLSYFSLFPEDFVILKNDLIDFWICEQLLGDISSRDDILNLGYNAMETIIGAGLLDDDDPNVKLLDMIRDAALSIAVGSPMFKNAQLLDATDLEKLATVGWISPMGNSIRSHVPDTLLAFLLNHNPFVMIKGQFAQFVDALTVLDLSKSGVVEIPRALSDLVSLQYLNLSHTWIERLPIELQVLKKLKCLNLEHNDQLRVLPKQLVYNLSALQILKLFRCGYSVEEVEDNILSLRYMDTDPLLSLAHLKVLSITITCLPTLENFFSNKKLLNSTQSLSLEVFWNLNSLDISPVSTMKNLHALEFHQIEDVEELNTNLLRRELLQEGSFKELREITLGKCSSLQDLTWAILVPNLKILKVESCEQMKEIVSIGKLGEMLKEVEDMEPFAKLEILALESLPELKSIYWKSLTFECLRKILIIDCVLLRKLPFNINSTKKSELVIEAEEDWWKYLAWEDDLTKSSFLPCFKPYF